ncbi:MAG: hypothetical protein DRJ03_05160 [Chloroflexi bacterium]|nr:MAG: hypothetical protein DRI81_00590 [Chloroflexota bacterium]RLC87735.1 MAG: hypothetical protein DRJ03_05160 [Chloroflexota bacterium]
MRRLWWAGALLALILALTAWLGPYALSSYHLEAGGRALDEATHPDLLAHATAHLEAASRWDEGNSHAYRLLGQAHLAQGEPLAAAKALSTYTRLRPDNPLGWWELGLAYEEMAQRAEGAVYWTLVPSFDDSASLQSAEVETPDTRIDTPYCEQGEAPQSCFITITEWEMPDAPQERFWAPESKARREVLFMHPPVQATFTVTLPVTPTALVFWTGIDPAAHAWMGDGVVYHVSVDGTHIFTRALTAEQARQGWQPAQVDLSAWAGRDARLTLTTDPGPAGDGQGDWAGWGNAQLVGAAEATCALVDPARRMRAAWEAGGVTAQDLTGAGEEARQAERYEESLGWYERAARMEPGLSDPWYYMGLAREGMEQWAEAVEAYTRAIALGHFRQTHRSSAYYRVGVIYQWKLEPQQAEKALAAYGAAIEADDFSSDWEAADCHYKRGEIYGWQGRNPRESIWEYQQAVTLNSKHHWAHLRLGHALYQASGDIVLAEKKIKQAIAVWPDDEHQKWPYWFLGDIYRETGMIDQAIVAYQKVLRLDPSDEQARDILTTLLKE